MGIVQDVRVNIRSSSNSSNRHVLNGLTCQGKHVIDANDVTDVIDVNDVSGHAEVSFGMKLSIIRF